MRSAAAIACLLAAALAGCGGSGDDDRAERPRTAPAPAPAPAPDPPGQGSSPFPPPEVPRRATGPAPAGAEQVVRRWAAAVRRADFKAAARQFAVPVRVQNGGPVVDLKTRDLVFGFSAALPCGARVTRVGGASGYTIADFRLVQRRGGDCGSGIGAPARVAFRIADGRITAFFRVPGPAEDPRPAPGDVV